MTSDEFKTQFEIDRNARGVKAQPRVVPETEQPAAIADGSSYRSNDTHWYFDQNHNLVRSTSGLKRIGAEYLGTDTLKIVRIDELYLERSEAIDAGQKVLLDKIEMLRDKICELEASKPKNERSMKRILQARGL